MYHMSQRDNGIWSGWQLVTITPNLKIPIKINLNNSNIGPYSLCLLYISKYKRELSTILGCTLAGTKKGTSGVEVVHPWNMPQHGGACF